MKMQLHITLLTGILTLSGCAAPLAQIDYYEVETEALQKIRTMQIIDDATLAAGGYRELGQVKGLYCDRSPPYAGTGEETAIDQIKLRAAIKGADHISTPSCETRTTWDLNNNCFSTVTCSATAISTVVR